MKMQAVFITNPFLISDLDYISDNRKMKTVCLYHYDIQALHGEPEVICFSYRYSFSFMALFPGLT
jgi:hypothetical protein